MDDLKADGLAPDNATLMMSVLALTAIVGDDGVVYRVAVWTGDGSLTTSGGLVDALLVGGGINSNNPSYGGRVNAGLISASQSNTVTVGVLGVPPNLAGTPCSRSALTNADTNALLAVAQAGTTTPERTKTNWPGAQPSLSLHPCRV